MKAKNALLISLSLLITSSLFAEEKTEKEPTYSLYYRPTPKKKVYVGGKYTADQASDIKSGWMTSGYGELVVEPSSQTKAPMTDREVFVSEIKNGIEKGNVKLIVQEEQPVFRVYVNEAHDQKKYIGDDTYSAAEAKDAVFKYKAYNDGNIDDLKVEKASGTKVVMVPTIAESEAKCVEKQMKEFSNFKEKYKGKDFMNHFSGDTTKITIIYQIKDKTKKLSADEASNLTINFSSTKAMKCNANRVADFLNFYSSYKPVMTPTPAVSPVLDKNTR
jgi:hypothetical protein